MIVPTNPEEWWRIDQTVSGDHYHAWKLGDHINQIHVLLIFMSSDTAGTIAVYVDGGSVLASLSRTKTLFG
jgi:hypothetical protein